MTSEPQRARPQPVAAVWSPAILFWCVVSWRHPGATGFSWVRHVENLLPAAGK